MKGIAQALWFSILLLASTTLARFSRGGGMKIGPIDEDTVFREAVEGATATTSGWGTFKQLIDHSNPRLGTFSQRYWYDTTFWKGPGSPVVMTNPGEQAADGFNKSYGTTQRLTGVVAQAVGAAVLILEHRYWGESSPYSQLTVENLRYLTLENSLKDNTYFAQNFEAPFDPSGRSNAKNSPWIFSGGSYPGALAGWLAALEPGTFWAYHSTSGVVESISNFWEYFSPVEAVTPANCSKDVGLVIEHIDDLLSHGTAVQKRELKNSFMLGDLEDADFASALEAGPWTWQEAQPYDGAGKGAYYEFCDYIENVWPDSSSSIPGLEGVGLTKALQGYAKWFREVSLPGNCESAGYVEWQGRYNTGCYASLNASNVVYKDPSLNNWGNRQWNWMLCNEPLKYWQTGAPRGQQTLVSRLVDVAYWEKQCAYWFPPSEGGFGIAKGKTSDQVNKFTGGWSVTNTTRLLYVNGEYDPWRDSTVSSDFRPGGPLRSTANQPVKVLPGGVHCSDLYAQNSAANPSLKTIVDDEVAILSRWVAEYYTSKKKGHARGRLNTV